MAPVCLQPLARAPWCSMRVCALSLQCVLSLLPSFRESLSPGHFWAEGVTTAQGFFFFPRWSQPKGLKIALSLKNNDKNEEL